MIAQKDAAPGGGGLIGMLPMVLALGALFYFIILRPQRREQQQRKDLINAIKKNDRVVTIGGIYGVVTNVKRDDDEVTIKVDESSNTKLRITFASISRVITDDAASES